MENKLRTYMNKETGEILTFSEMIVQAMEWYDIPDETNMFSFADKFEDVTDEGCSYIPHTKESLFESMQSVLHEKDFIMESALVDFTLDMCRISGVNRMGDLKMILEFTFEEEAEMKYREQLINNCQQRIAETREKLDTMQSGTYNQIKPLFDLIDDLTERIGVLYTDLWDYRKSRIEEKIRRVREFDSRTRYARGV